MNISHQTPTRQRKIEQVRQRAASALHESREEDFRRHTEAVDNEKQRLKALHNPAPSVGSGGKLTSGYL